MTANVSACSLRCLKKHFTLNSAVTASTLNVVSVSFCSDQTYRDVAVIAGGVTFKFHSSLFSMHSNYFAKVMNVINFDTSWFYVVYGSRRK